MKKMKTYKQWEIPNNSRVVLKDGTEATYLKMDGMYAQWDVNGDMKIGNFDKLEEVGNHYKVIS